MGGTDLIILAATCIGTFLLCRLRGLRQWGQALSSRPESAAFIIAGMLATFIGGTAYDASSLIPDATRATRMAILGAIFLVAIKNILSIPGCWQNAGTGVRWMFFYALFAISSAVYSVGPLISVYKGMEVLILVTAAISVAGRLRTRDDLQWLLDLFSLILLFVAISTVAGVIIAPGEAFRAGAVEATSMTRTVRGLLFPLNPTSVGGIGAFLLVSALVPALDKNSTRSKAGLWLVVALATVVMFFAHARTAIFGATIAVAAILIFNRQVVLAVTLSVLGALVLLLTSFGDLILSYIYRGQSQELFLSMSGRTHHWGVIFDEYMRSPILGHGFYAGIRVLFGTSSSDNTYLEVLLGLGIVGLTIFAVPVLYLIVSLLRTRPRRRDAWEGDTLWLQLTALGIIITTRSAVGASFQVLHHLLAFYMILQLSVAAYVRLWNAHQAGHSPPEKAGDPEAPGDAPSAQQPFIPKKPRGPLNWPPEKN